MAMKTITNCEYKLRSPSIPEIIFTNKPPKYLKHYQIGAKIGKGSYATVREAIDTNTNELVAIKICSKRKLARIAGGLRAVRKEARILSLLDHENTIKLIEKFSLPEKEKIYLIMQNVNCGNLEQLIQRNEGMGLPMKQIQSLFHDLLKGLLYLREKRIVHGDIKPENLLLSNEGRLVITDFGVSRMLRKKKSKKHLRETLSCDQLRFVRKHSNQSSRSDTLTSDRTSDESVQFSSNEEDDDFRSKMHEDNEENNDKDKNNGKNYGMNHTAQGTIAFEPPEVASGKKRYSKCGHELDLWAAGIVLYYLATGRYPFKGSSFMELILNISNGVFEDLPSDLDSDLVILIKSMLNADPKKRPSIDDLFSFPFVKKEFKSKKSCKVVENDSIFTRKKDGKYYFIEKKDQTDQCVIC